MPDRFLSKESIMKFLLLDFDQFLSKIDDLLLENFEENIRGKQEIEANDQ